MIKRAVGKADRALVGGGIRAGNLVEWPGLFLSGLGGGARQQHCRGAETALEQVKQWREWNLYSLWTDHGRHYWTD